MSEHISEFEQCDHMRCEFPYRRDYCELDGRDPDVEVAVVVDMIDEVVYNAKDFGRGGFYHRSDEAGSFSERRFEMIGGDIATWVWPLVETQVTIRHSVNKHLSHERFEIHTGWVVQQVDAPDKPYQTNYAIDIWPGSAIATVSEYRLGTEMLHEAIIPMQERPMVPYDHNVLFDLLSTIADMQKGIIKETEACAGFPQAN